MLSFLSPNPGDQSETLLNTHSPCWALLRASHGGRVSEYPFISHPKHPCNVRLLLKVSSAVFTALRVSSSCSLDRGSYSKGSPRIRIDRDLEENSFFWRKGSETDLWMSYAKKRPAKTSTAKQSVCRFVIVCTYMYIFFFKFLLGGFKSERLEVFLLAVEARWSVSEGSSCPSSGRKQKGHLQNQRFAVSVEQLNQMTVCTLIYTKCPATDIY